MKSNVFTLGYFPMHTCYNHATPNDGQRMNEDNASDSILHTTNTLCSVLLCMLIAMSIVMVFYPSSHGRWIFDDNAAIADNLSVAQPTYQTVLVPPRDLPTSGRPLLNLSFAINYHFSKDQPQGYRWTNIAIHVLNSWLLFALIARLLATLSFSGVLSTAMQTWTACIITLLWALHPVQTECVLYVAQRSEQLAMLTLLGTLYGLVRHHQSQCKHHHWLIISVLFCFAGALCKELAAVYPIIVLCCDRSFLSGSFKAAWQQRRGYYGIMSLLTWSAILWLLMGKPRTLSAGYGLGISAWEYLMTQSQVILHYLKIIVDPADLCLAYHWPIVRSFDVVAVPFTCMALLFACSCIALWRWPRVGFCMISSFLVLAPSSSVYPIMTEVAADRRITIPAAFILSLTVVMLLRVVMHCKPNATRRAWYMTMLLGMIGVMILAPMTLIAGYRYNNTIQLWEHMVLTARQPLMAQEELAKAMLLEDALAPTHQLYEQILRENGSIYLVQLNLGLVKLKLGQATQGLAMLNGIADHPKLGAKANYYMGLHYKATNQVDLALECFRKAWQTQPTNPEYVLNLAQMLVLQKQFDEATRTIEALPKHQRQTRDILAVHGYALSQLNRLEQAQAVYTRYLQLDPDNPALLNSLGTVEARLGHMEQAASYFARALAINPDMPDVKENLKRARSLIQSQETSPETQVPGL